MGANRDLIEKLYGAFETSDLELVLGTLAEDVAWTVSAGHPYGGTYVGAPAVVEHVQLPTMRDWDDFAVETAELLEDGDVVIGLGAYKGSCKATGKPLVARFAHVWRVAGGKVTSFESVSDTAQFHEATAP